MIYPAKGVPRRNLIGDIVIDFFRSKGKATANEFTRFYWGVSAHKEIKFLEKVNILEEEVINKTTFYTFNQRLWDRLEKNLTKTVVLQVNV